MIPSNRVRRRKHSCDLYTNTEDAWPIMQSWGESLRLHTPAGSADHLKNK